MAAVKSLPLLLVNVTVINLVPCNEGTCWGGGVAVAERSATFCFALPGNGAVGHRFVHAGYFMISTTFF